MLYFTQNVEHYKVENTVTKEGLFFMDALNFLCEDK